MAVTILAYIACFGLYGATIASYSSLRSNPHNPIWQLAALWPPTAFSAFYGGWSKSMPPLCWDHDVSWAVVGTAYIVIAAMALGMTSLFLRRLPGVREE